MFDLWVALSSSHRVPGYGSTVWAEDRIDDNVLPPTRTLKKGATSNLQTMTHIFKGNIGTGILAMPYAFSNSGEKHVVLRLSTCPWIIRVSKALRYAQSLWDSEGYFLSPYPGVWAGFVGTAVIAFIAIHCMRLLVESSHYLCHLTGRETLDYGYCMDFAFKNVEGTWLDAQ